MAIGLLGMTAIFAVVGAAAKGIQYLIDQNNAEEALELERTQSEEELQLALDQAESELEVHLGQIGTEFEDYDAWYAAQQAEWAADDQGMTFEDYLRSQQTTELGNYGIERARLEAQVQIARENIAIAREELAIRREDIAAQHGFAADEYAAGVTQSERVTRGEAAAVAAMGIRGGTAAATVAENQRVRMESLDLYMDRANWAQEVAIKYADQAEARLDLGEEEIETMMEIDLAALDQSVLNVRTAYDFNVAALTMGQEHGMETLDLAFEQQFNPLQASMNIVGGALQGAQLGFSVYTAGVGAGLWGFESAGAFAPMAQGASAGVSYTGANYYTPWGYTGPGLGM